MSTRMLAKSNLQHIHTPVEETIIRKEVRVIEEVSLPPWVGLPEVDPSGVLVNRLDDSTLSPRKESTQPSSEAIEYRGFRSLIERANEVFGDQLKASLWLSTPSVDLDGKVPMQVAQEVHYSSAELERLFEPIFIHIEHGIYT